MTPTASRRASPSAAATSSTTRSGASCRGGSTRTRPATTSAFFQRGREGQSVDKAGRGSVNPMLSIFSGVHDIQVDAHAYGRNGRGFVQVDTVALDGVEIPRFVLQLFVQKYLQPKYPEVGLDSQFALPDRVDTAVVGQHKLAVVQK